MRLGRRLKSSDPEVLHAVLAEARHLVDQAILQTQSLTFDLSSPVLYTLGLPAALDQLCRETAKEHRLRVTFRDDGKPKDMPNDQQVILYQSARELLRNVVKHAEARHVAVACAYDEGEVSVSVEDDGVGFDTAGAGLGFSRSGGFGLFNLRERLAHLGGRFVLESCRDNGTRALIELPVSRTEDESEVTT